MKIGIAGTGRMGAALASRLLGLGHSVAVWNRTAAKAYPLGADGATLAATPSELATGADFVISVLTDAAAIDATYEGAKGLLAGEVRGKLFVDMSTVRPEVEAALAGRVRARGAALVECPVGGSVGPAREGKLFGFVGGAAADVARARPLLEQLCRRVEHVGAVGAGASLKLAINLPLLVYYQALGEALSLCRGLDLESARLLDIFADTSGGPNMLKTRGATIAAALDGKPTAPVTFDVDLVRKDLRIMLEEGTGLGVELPLTARALACYDALAQDGLGGSDASMLPAHWLRRPR